MTLMNSITLLHIWCGFWLAAALVWITVIAANNNLLGRWTRYEDHTPRLIG